MPPADEVDSTNKTEDAPSGENGRRRRKSGQGSRPYRRKDGRWGCYVTVRDDEGNPKRKWFYGWSKDEVEAKRRDALAYQTFDNNLLALEQVREGHYVYFVQSALGGPVKIGRTNNIEQRLKMLQASCPWPLKVIHVIKDAPPAFETKLHKCFAHHRLHGEWFDNADELMRYVYGLRKPHKLGELSIASGHDLEAYRASIRP